METMVLAGTEQHWPPRSPHEALLSSPSGRDRIRKYQERTSPSPSPLKNSSLLRGMAGLQRRLENQGPNAEEDEEDEETLQLRLDALEARLKLKRLQQKKSKARAGDSDVENQRPTILVAGSREEEKNSSEEIDWLKLGQPLPKMKAARNIQVPVSPSRKPTAKKTPESPGRVLLGIDKGLKGNNVSLRAAPDEKRRQGTLRDPFQDRPFHRGICQEKFESSARNCQSSSTKPPTFSERIAATRQHDRNQQDKLKKLQLSRSVGFGIEQERTDAFKAAAAEEEALQASHKFSQKKQGFSREDVLKAVNKPNTGLVRRSSGENPSQRRREFKNPNASPGFVVSTANRKPNPRSRSKSPPPTKQAPDTSSTDCSLFEPFSSLHLSKRFIPHDSLTKALTSKSILLLPDVLSTIKAPDYAFPDDLDPDIVVIALIASKSSPFAHKNAHRSNQTLPSSSDVPTSSLTEAAESEVNTRGKFMILTLTDLKWNLELYLFTTAFTRWWKLTPGTLIAILNPSIMPPPPHNRYNNRFSLTLSSSDDTILEIGTSRDLSWCEAMKKDGKPCGSWIDKRHTSVCEFHIDRVIEKTRQGRMEINGMSAPFGPGGRRGGRTGMWGASRRRGAGGGGGSDEGGENRYSAGIGKERENSEGRRYDRSSHSTIFMSASSSHAGFGPSAAKLLDADSLTDRTNREERVRKRMAEREREREIARKLGEGGNGMAAEYLKMSSTSDGNHMSEGCGGPRLNQGNEEGGGVDVKELGLLGGRAGEIHLSPVKKRKVGRWQGEGKGEGQRKKTRFVTEKGIREAGRESLGAAAGGQQEPGGMESEDEDGLEIV